MFKIDDWLETRRTERASEQLFLRVSGSPAEAEAFAKGETNGYAWCTDGGDDKRVFDPTETIGTLDARSCVVGVAVVDAALGLSAAQRANAIGFVSGVRRFWRDAS